MDVRHITRVRAAIVDVLEGNLGLVRVPEGVFAHRVFRWLAVDRQRTLAMTCGARHAFDVRLAQSSIHSGSPGSNSGSHEVRTLDVEIMCFTSKRSTLRADDRTEILDYVIADGDEAVQALSDPQAMETTLNGEQTIIVSGLMLGPGGEGTPLLPPADEAYDDELVRWSIVGTVILNIPQNAPA